MRKLPLVAGYFRRGHRTVGNPAGFRVRADPSPSRRPESRNRLGYPQPALPAAGGLKTKEQKETVGKGILRESGSKACSSRAGAGRLIPPAQGVEAVLRREIASDWMGHIG